MKLTIDELDKKEYIFRRVASKSMGRSKEILYSFKMMEWIVRTNTGSVFTQREFNEKYPALDAYNSFDV